MDHEQLEEHLSLYALGTLEPDSAREVESHLASGCPHCGALLRQYQGTAGMLPYALALTTPPTELKAKIMRAITGQVDPEDVPATAATPILPPTKSETPPAKISIPPPSDTATLILPPTTPETSPAKMSIPPPPPSPVPRPAAWQAVAESLDKSAPLAPAPSQVRRRLASEQNRPAGQSRALAASLAGLLLGIGGYAYYLYATVEDERAANVADRMALAKANLKVSDLERLLDERQRNLSKATSELNRAVQALGTTHKLLAKHQEQIETLQASRLGKPAEDIARIFSSPYARMATLNGTGLARDAYAMVFMEPDTRRGFFYANNLPALPAGKTYQLWIITDTPKPVSAGVFSLDRGRKGRGMLQNMPEAAKIKQFAVSLEPDGGKPQPTGAVYLAGDL